jgi:predicted ATP-grasp superfamily ATP-dependent carboligase
MTSLDAPVRARSATPSELAAWDAVLGQFPNHRVVHTRAWIESLRASGHGRPLYLVFERGGEIVAGMPGLRTTVAGVRLFGSPMAGWQTSGMGPAFDPGRVSTTALMTALVELLEREHGVAHVEVMHDQLESDAMRRLGFTGEPVPTYRAPLFPGDEARGLRALKDAARRNVRRAERLGLVTRFETHERFVDEHYDQLREVCIRRGSTVSFPQERMLECFRHMHSARKLLAISVYHPARQVSIATGMFLIAPPELMLWSWAHREHYRWYRPTEVMTWTVMRRAMEAGCTTFDLMGRGDFKAKFGAELDETRWRWTRSRRRWLAVARNAAQLAFRTQQAVRGRVRRAVRHGAIAHRTDGADHHHARACLMGDIDLVQALARSGVPSVVMAAPGSPARYSRSTLAALPWVGSWDASDRLVDILLDYAVTEPEPPVLLYDSDRALLVVSRHRDRLAKGFRFVVPDRGLVEQLVDKAQFQQLAARTGLPVPPARVLEPTDGPPPGDLGLDFPIIVKPFTRRADWWTELGGGGKAVQIDTPAGLRAFWPRLVAARSPMLAQSLVPGPENMIESYHAYVDGRGEVVGEFTGRKIRTHPRRFGDSTALEITDAADVAGLGRDVLRRVGLRGVAKLDFKRSPDGRLWLFEINPRFTLWNHLGAVAGVNIPALVYADLVSLPRPAVEKARPGVQWCKLWWDWPAARDEGQSLVRWLPWALRCEAKSGVSWDDPFPLARAALWRWRAGLRPRPAAPAPSRVALPAFPLTSRATTDGVDRG